ncbi:dynamin family protein [Psychrobacter sp. FBL11]|uniref:Dynamin family protein n=1 Tax=Psychrobacter saeujeotis TaxID=3143436 RepID=A0ABU9X780_9GAMM|nr:dynamin family protein [uncultured Psychrobacter sp.]
MNKLTWSEVYQHRFEWAKSAHSKFMLNFDNDLYSTQEIKDQIFVAVYGPSQVGKTSLILELIGVLPEHHGKVQNVLRANRDYGKSATATVVRYRTSINNYWYINEVNSSSKNRKKLNNDEAKKELAEIRSKMEDMGGRYKIEEIDISIPEVYISNSRIKNKDIVIRDLPGVKAENDNEREFVSKVIKDKIEKSDLVLLVTTIDNMGLVVQPENLEIDNLQKWKVNPQRFKIIFTRFYSDDSSLKLCTQLYDSRGSIDIDDVRTHIQKQIHTLDSDFRSDVKSQLYALEVGDSWYKLLTDNKEEQQPLIDTRKVFFDELKEVIYSASNPIIRLCHGYQIGEISKNFKLEKNQEVNITLANLEKEISNINEEIRENNNIIDNYRKSINEEIETTNSQIKEIQNLYHKCNNVFSEASIEELYETVKESEQKNTTVLAGYLLQNIEKFKIKWDEIKRECIGSIDISQFPYLNDIDDVNSHLKNYNFKTYFFNDKFNNDLNKIKAILGNQLLTIRDSLKEHFSGYLDKIKIEINLRVSKYRNFIAKLEKRKIYLVKTKYILIQDKSSLEDKLKIFNYSRDLEIEHSEKFSVFVNNEFKVALKKLSGYAKKETDNITMLYWIMLIRQLNIDFKVVEGKNERKK